jgi:hypothetical protein
MFRKTRNAGVIEESTSPLVLRIQDDMRGDEFFVSYFSWLMPSLGILASHTYLRKPRGQEVYFIEHQQSHSLL